MKVRLVILMLLWFAVLSLKAQIAYSPVIDSLILMVNQETVGLADRQLSGDTSVMVAGISQTITTRNYQFNSMQNIAAQLIRERMESYGLETRFQDYSSTGRNIIGWKTGSKYPEKKYFICAHYDDMPTTLIAPGADDNASGVVAVLEAARLLAPYDTEYTLVFAAWDEEEIGLVGSEAYADSAALAGEQIMGVLNYDMIAWDSDNDYRMTLGTNALSLTLTNDYEKVMQIYTPEINWDYTDIEASDHASFWHVGYPALLGIEDNSDFNAYYHTPDDSFENLNLPYFTRMVQAAVAGLATLGWNCRMGLLHQAIPSGVDTLEQIAALKVTTPRTIGYGSNHPRLYYKVNESDFDFVSPSSVSGNVYNFTLPAQPYGTTVSYYFAVQDEDGIIIETLPKGGRGVNPPGTIQPAQFYSYLVSPDQIQRLCSSTTPKIIPDLSVVYDTIAVAFEGGVKDIDVEVNIQHTRVVSLNISLIGPDGTSIDLSSGNGGSGSNFTQTIFDDEAPVSILNGTPPYTGRYRPEQPLSSFDTKNAYGNWILRVKDSLVSQTGTLNDWCLTINSYDLNATIQEDVTEPGLVLGQNFPNPVRSGITTIPFIIKERSNVEISVYNSMGVKVRAVLEKNLEKGNHRVACRLEGLTPGAYFYRITDGNGVKTRMMLISQ